MKEEKRESKIVFEEFPRNRKAKEEKIIDKKENYNIKNKEIIVNKNSFKYVLLLIIIILCFLASSFLNKYVLELMY